MSTFPRLYCLRRHPVLIGRPFVPRRAVAARRWRLVRRLILVSLLIFWAAVVAAFFLVGG